MDTILMSPVQHGDLRCNSVNWLRTDPVDVVGKRNVVLLQQRVVEHVVGLLGDILLHAGQDHAHVVRSCQVQGDLGSDPHLKQAQRQGEEISVRVTLWEPVDMVESKPRVGLSAAAPNVVISALLTHFMNIAEHGSVIVLREVHRGGLDVLVSEALRLESFKGLKHGDDNFLGLLR
jgi:hypothetical protein